MRKNPLCVTCHQPATFASVLNHPIAILKLNGKVKREGGQTVTYYCDEHIGRFT